LCPRSWSYKKRSGRATTKKLSAIQLACQQLEDNPLVPWAAEQLESGSAQVAHTLLKKINGVGDKIASLFLRDIATIYAITVGDDQKWRLQPIDMWLRFVVWKLQARKLNDDQCAQFVVTNSMTPEKTNQGVWYFCNRVAGSSRYMVSRSIDDVGCFQETISLHLHQLRKSRDAAARLISHLSFN
jgi:hypothetical protein